MTDVAESSQNSPTGAVSPHQPLIFISHDSRDAQTAEAFSKLLSSVSAGMLKSFRSSDNKGTQGLEYGSDWYPEIVKKVADASDVVCLLTDRSVNRPWILYEAGLAKGKLNAPVHGLALGIPLNRASIGPFAQFQNCGDDIESLTKLAIQLVKRLPSAAPDRDMVKTQVETFRKRAGAIASSTAEGVSEEGSEALDLAENAKIFEEIKMMFQELPGRIDEIVNRAGMQSFSVDPSPIDMRIARELIEVEKPGFVQGLGAKYIILASPLRNIFPWLYEFACEAYRAEARHDSKSAAQARRNFAQGVEFVSHLPIGGLAEIAHHVLTMQRRSSPE